jgi:hypothetical protein
VHIFGNLRHVTAVRGLMENNVDSLERSSNRIAIPHVALDEFRFGIYPRRFSAAVRLRLEIIQSAHLPAFAHEKIDNVRADQTRGASDECAFHHLVSVAAVSDRRKCQIGARRAPLQLFLRGKFGQKFASVRRNIHRGRIDQ